MNQTDSSRRPGGGRSGAWWLRWLAILGGAGAFAWALGAILNGGVPAGRAEERARPETLSGQEPPSFSAQEWRREEAGREGFWEHEEGEDDDEGWEEEHGALGEFGFLGPAPNRRAPDVRTRPS